MEKILIPTSFGAAIIEASEVSMAKSKSSRQRSCFKRQAKIPTSMESQDKKRDSVERIRTFAIEAMTITIEQGLHAYCRQRALAPFHRLSKETIAAETAEAAESVLRELARALRAERARKGHWSYDLNRQIGLTIAYRSEKLRANRILKARRETACPCQAKVDSSRAVRPRLPTSSAP
jgi:hypothetical protein